ncbi:MAG: Putative diheme cytochrome c-553 [uncultured Gemmatimonadetes bacterium]|uniref:Diheme cytochrome c-553 n=1 Tax=uncultured Gemmatimonadota bacterium TaxID=203437 RepID=A0A6J4N100_9BACT|nr:MAG: Putative diheme cytochrome c-553 [uncultured Gemmatimonadota bacterium]
MKKWMKRLGIGLGGLMVLLLVAFAVAYGASKRRLDKTWDVSGAALNITRDPAQVARGKHVATAVSKCTECHGEDLGGKVFIDGMPMGMLIASNLTAGKGGVLPRYSDAQLEAAIRHGVRHDKRGLLFMPSDEFQHLSDEDVAAVIAYMRSVPPVDRELAPSKVGPLGHVLFATGQLPLVPAEKIDHTPRTRRVPPAGVTREYGQYLTSVGGCTGCHGPDLAGSSGHGPAAPNITPAGTVGAWSEADWFRAMRQGKRPDGSVINPPMPWQSVGRMTDDEMRAMWMYLRTVPRVEPQAKS